MSDREPNALAERQDARAGPVRGRSPDPYEAQYMAGQGTVLHRAKERAPWYLQMVMALPLVAALPAALGASGGLVGLAIAAPVSLVLWTLFSVLRVTVSERRVDVQYGLFGPKIPVDAIEHAEATTYDWKKFGGWGIRRSMDGEWIYNMPGDQGRAVRIVWRDAKGRKKVTLIGSKTPHDLAEAIATARALPEAADPSAITEGEPADEAEATPT